MYKVIKNNMEEYILVCIDENDNKFDILQDQKDVHFVDELKNYVSVQMFVMKNTKCFTTEELEALLNSKQTLMTKFKKFFREWSLYEGNRAFLPSERIGNAPIEFVTASNLTERTLYLDYDIIASNLDDVRFARFGYEGSKCLDVSFVATRDQIARIVYQLQNETNTKELDDSLEK
ncbi:MAG: hypothetical protein E7378_01690 [Clostridiales bacterium]|nr:hypothetical protein [Clostridiales bacterium]